MIIDAISNGIVIDHISAGKAMELYNILGLDKLDCSVALLKNVSSGKLGRKDIIKIDRVLDLDWDVIGYVDPDITMRKRAPTAACTARPRPKSKKSKKRGP